MEEFGCTSNAMQFYTDKSAGDYHTADRITAWNLDLIADPEGNQIQVTYQNDSASGYDGLSYPREQELATIEWDSPTCQDAVNRCSTSGTAPDLWSPLHRIVFDMAHTPTRITGTPQQPCNPASTGSSPTLRCDDPYDETGNGGFGIPDIENTEVLNDVKVQTRASGGSTSWNTLLTYLASYAQSGPTVTDDPITNFPISYAGSLLLTEWQTVGTDGITAAPTLQFGYAALDAFYEDTYYETGSESNCGPFGNLSCYLWSETSQANDEYLAYSSNGQGLSTVYDWTLARNNTHDISVYGQGASPADPYYCDGKENQLGPPCNITDDENWSREVLTEEDNSVIRASSKGNVTITGKTYYSYYLTYPLVAQECSDWMGKP